MAKTQGSPHDKYYACFIWIIFTIRFADVTEKDLKRSQHPNQPRNADFRSFPLLYDDTDVW